MSLLRKPGNHYRGRMHSYILRTIAKCSLEKVHSLLLNAVRWAFLKTCVGVTRSRPVAAHVFLFLQISVEALFPVSLEKKGDEVKRTRRVWILQADRRHENRGRRR